ncbi:TadA family conjugal transfer-associated ATPase [Blastococcus sp. Marseille-P5729]|uniref:TadA family conjugal transfer-associated ATPase n=1 Tax=Blastococcus sp. Marseille-P5729 TaxID=2086582 RepID=UPI000D0FC1B5|nr:TadA family conjugal transfer-associated ATPase [Blastococcus sp. Marseille-P5729]
MTPPQRDTLIHEVRRRCADAGDDIDTARLAELIRDEAKGLISDRELLDVLAETEAAVLGAGPLEPLLAAEDVTDVLVNGPDDVWIDRGAGLQRSAVTLESPTAVSDLAQRLAARAGRRLDAAHPWVDATLPDGSRLHAIIPPLAVDCALVSIRTMRRRTLGLDDLVDAGLDAAVADLLVEIVRSRLSFLVSGGTGSGKTTLLSMLLEHVDPRERVVVAEDADELRPAHPHTVKLLSRPANIEGSGEITLRTLVRQALRMRPDRIVVGEVRGAEVTELLMALNTGHRGGAGTVHANSVHDVPARICALGMLADLSAEAVEAQLGSAVDVLIHVGRERSGRRGIGQIALLRTVDRRPTVIPVWHAGTGFTKAAELLGALLGDQR